ncbi:DUF2946 family protein [Roseiterribacter gracilis]|uniref:DUF2946 domain-containing protein n=1 Tax=Roseiterribacter gracilis TaxID=2812848 RepID=A0A8S8X609_9PROT|nr:hypothetical protein TMPK1_01100 [Rhodospirillales bacterium TMPK1]
MRTARKFAKPALRPAALLAILAILLRAAIPGGFMLSSAKAGGMPDLVVCTSQGLMTIAHDADPASADSDSKQDTSCAFTATSAVTIAPTLVQIAAPTYAVMATVQRAVADQRPGRGLAAPPPPTTGPPSLI